jgi:two-component system, NtrC family, response regulator AtoC
MALDEMDSYIIQTALEKSGYNVTATARALGTTRETLRYRIQKYNLRTAAAETETGWGTRAPSDSAL